MNYKDDLAFEFENSANKKYLVTFMNIEDKIIEFEMEMINTNSSCGAINIETRQFDDKIKILFDTTGKVSLVEFFKNNSLKRGEFLTILRNLSRVLLECKNCFLDEKKYFMNLDYIYINPIDLCVNYVYLPFERVFSGEWSLKYREIVNKIISEYAKFEDQVNDSVAEKILIYFKKDRFSITEFNRFIEEFRQGKVKVFYGTGRIKEEKVKELIKVAAVPITVAPVLANEKYGITKVFSNIFGKKSKGKESAGSPKANVVLINPSFNNPSSGDLSTKLPLQTACLLSNKAGMVEKIHINKEVFKIGRLPGEVDYLANNKAIGRIHMELRTVNSKYYIVDLNSRNGTFINGRRLEANKEYKIENKDILMLADCEFTFQID